MKDFDDFLSHVMPYAPGCAYPTAISALRQAAIEFCQRTRLWRSDDEFPITPDNCEVICVPTGAELIEIEHVTFNGFPLTPVSISELDRDHPYWRNGETSTMPQSYTQIAMDTIRVVPGAEGLLKVYTILMPSQDADQVPDWLVTKFARVIAAGALKDILILPGQPFTSPELAAGFSNRFYNALDDKASLHVRGQQRAPIRTRPQFL